MVMALLNLPCSSQIFNTYCSSIFEFERFTDLSRDSLIKNRGCFKVANASMGADNFSKFVQLIFKYTLKHVDQSLVTRTYYVVA